MIQTRPHPAAVVNIPTLFSTSRSDDRYDRLDVTVQYILYFCSQEAHVYF